MAMNLAKEVVFFFLSGLGVVGNLLVFVNYLCTLGAGTKKQAIHILLTQFAFTHLLLLLSKGIPKLALDFDLTSSPGGICKLVYLERVARGLSICTSSLLAVVQAATISPSTSAWRCLKPTRAWQFLPMLLPFWLLSSLVSMHLLSANTDRQTNASHLKDTGACFHFLPRNQITNRPFLSLMALRDALFLGAMGGASGYMVRLLHQHHQRVLYLQNPKPPPRPAPELRAARSVLLLMLCFLIFYCADCVFSLRITFSVEFSSVVYIQEFLGAGYAILSPFLLIHRDGHVAKYIFGQWKKKNFRIFAFRSSFQHV